MEPVQWRSCDGGCLAYGLAADGRLAHVAEVVRGLACGCRCPACGGDLVARRGELRAAHFAHHAAGECAGAWKTTLHLLAKEVLSASRSVLLPEAVAAFGGERDRIAGPTWFGYDSVREEVDLTSVRPDVVVTGAGRDLLVEVAVTHFCDAEKSRSCGPATWRPSRSTFRGCPGWPAGRSTHASSSAKRPGPGCTTQSWWPRRTGCARRPGGGGPSAWSA